MYKLTKHALFVAMLAGSAIMYAAPTFAKVDIAWQNPEEFADIESTLGTRKKYQAHVFAEIQKFIDGKLMSQLPEGYTLSITVTDFDMAGRVWPAMMVGLSGSGDIRLIKTIEPPRIELSYELKDESGVVLTSGQESYRDMTFMDRPDVSVRSTDALRYEKSMIRRWFLERFESYLVKQNT